ncbi:MAG: hypothetical protein WCC60_11600 [Ilumatobacteraceae bacterium]
MSAIRSTLPAAFKNASRPSADNADVTAFGPAACPAVKFRFEVPGQGLSAGNTDTKPPSEGLTNVTFNDTAVAELGIVHFPFAPHTGAT